MAVEPEGNLKIGVFFIEPCREAAVSWQVG
jgi:hypothetical protein